MSDFFRDQRFLVTGGGGFLGSFVVEALQARGARQVFVPRSREFNLVDREAVRRVFHASQPDVVFHLAARVGGIGANRREPGAFFYENLMLGAHVLDEARVRRTTKVVAVGSVCSYPKHAPVPFREDAIWDGYPEESNAPYGLAKKMLIVQSQAYRAQYGLSSIVLLPVNLYGPRDHFDPASSHVIPALVRRFVEARRDGLAEVTCWGDGSPTREFLHARDCAEGLMLAAEHYDGADPVNLGTGTETSIRALATLVAELCGYEGRLVWDPSAPNGQARRCLDVSRARAFGFEARTSLRDGLVETIAWYRSQLER